MNEKSERTDLGFLVLILFLSVFVFGFKFRGEIANFYLKYRHIIAFSITVAIVTAYLKIKNMVLLRFKQKDLENEIIGPCHTEDTVFAGISPTGKSVFIKQSFRRMHTQVVGTTNAGKTESVIIPWAIDDIKKGRGLLIIDGKSDRGLLDKLYAYAKKHHREHDVRILSLCNVDISHTFNPFSNGSVLEVCERVFAALNFENEYFKSIQYDAFLHCLLLLEDAGIKATPYRVIECLKYEKILAGFGKNTKKGNLKNWVNDFINLDRDEREQRTSGLVSQLQIFAVGDAACIFNTENSDIDLERALDGNEIIYCQLPALKIPTLGKAVGKIILQCLQSAVSSRHLGQSTNNQFFSVYLDDFTEYLTPSFVTLLNKSRSANVGVVFAHQALGDLSGLGEGVKNTILTNSNLKVFMRTNEPESAEYFSSVIGTSQSSQVTERQRDGLLGPTKTGEGSVRETEEFKFHPNIFKQDLGVGEAVVVLPHAKGSLPVRIKFKRSFDLDKPEIPKLKKTSPVGIASVSLPSSTSNQAITDLITQERRAA